MKKSIVVLLMSIIASLNTFPILAQSDIRFVYSQDGVLLPLNTNGSIYVGGNDITPVNSKDEITRYMRDNSLTLSEKLTYIKEQIAFIPPTEQHQIIQATDLSDVEKSLLYTECMYTPEQYSSIMQKFHTSVYNTSMISLPGIFTCYAQEKWNYCMPAVTQSTVDYLTGSILSQSSIASDLQITDFTMGHMSDLQECINGYQSERYYIYREKYSLTVFTSCVNYDIDTVHCPTIVNIYAPETGQWYYRTDIGHALNINAISASGAETQIADPLINSDFAPETDLDSCFYGCSTSTLYAILVDFLY